MTSTTRQGRRGAFNAPRRPRRFHPTWHFWFALPAIILVLAFFLVPFLANAGFAFTQWTAYSSDITWNGFENFRTLADLGVLGHAVLITLVYAAVSMLVQNVGGLFLANALQEPTRVNNVFRAVFFIPVLVSGLAAGYIWAALLAAQGPLNQFLSAILPGGFVYSWLGNPVSALVAVAFVDAWKWVGLAMTVYIAGLNAIPKQLFEAAALDGAGPWRRFWKVKVPLLAPAFSFNVVIGIVGALSSLDIIFAATGGGPGDATTVLQVASYRQYGQGLFGTASALSLVIAVIGVVIAIPLISALRRREVRL
ncbi:sugar ABC transporter permease [Herbiconiux sp. CPCC 205716]|uniref:Sugar ABC transporter permease n=1 Tax=Herbiconiux gentiana TaxID=2970912 RepID=A0ABT2GAD5_9MICO|nr:sugar ABC transporter permease [Herbiconiux gentiana]MCS5713158.1 sugar ABC transporter permease [Herbiconiux gentiana]